MSSVRLSTRYAKSLLDLAVVKGNLETIHADMLSIEASIKGSRELRLLLKSPIINSDKKHNVLTAIFKGKLDAMTQTFIDLMVKKGREQYLYDVAEAFIVQYNKFKHITKVKLTTAAATDKKTVDAIVNDVKAKMNLEHVELELAVDPELIGGFVLKYEDKLFDASIARQLNLMRKDFSDESYVAKI